MLFEPTYKVDLRDRKTGNPIECIYSGDDYNKAYEIADNWNKENLADFKEEIYFGDYIDYKTEGMSAYVYSVLERVRLNI